jgi:uncharacterized protein (DUF2252 family)
MPSPESRLRAERVSTAAAATAQAPIATHADLTVAANRDPIRLLLAQETTRIPELVPVRHGRMLASPFAFFRGAALPMAADLAQLPSSGLWVQLCGDAHLANFGAFASPERRLMFDINDFDETLPGPFEWDLKRFAASLAIAGRANGFSTKDRRRVMVNVLGRYRSSMQKFAAMPLLDVWYAHLDLEDLIVKFRSQHQHKGAKQVEATVAKARTRDQLQVSNKMTHVVNGVPQIVANPPLVVPIEDLTDLDADAVAAFLRTQERRYRRSLEGDRRFLLDRFRLVHAARKVVGVGSVGTRDWILLFVADDESVLFLQYKEAQPSGLSGYLGGSAFDNQGERVVQGQRLIQAVSDIFLGWQRVDAPQSRTQDYYVRQLRDGKVSQSIEALSASGMIQYGRLCAWTLARAHARTGDRVALTEYMGSSDHFENALAEFGEAYADQNERDFAALADAVASGQVEAVRGL